MSANPNQRACPFCAASLPHDEVPCSACHASAEAIDLAVASDFAKLCFAQWKVQGLVSEAECHALNPFYDQRRQLLKTRTAAPLFLELESIQKRCWRCAASAPLGQEFCPQCFAITNGLRHTKVRHIRMLAADIAKHQANGTLGFRSAHACLNEIKQRLATFKQKLEGDSLTLVAAAEPPAPPPTKNFQGTPPPVATQPFSPKEDFEDWNRMRQGAKPTSPHAPSNPSPIATPPPAPSWRSIWDLLLDPRALHGLLAVGAGFLVIGLVLWLMTFGIFENPIVLAGIMGALNGLLLLAGGAIVEKTRFQTAGRALTLLACLVMPLNLWFYHSQGLLTFDGQLWVAAFVMALLYAAAAYILRDPWIIPVFSFSVPLTGLLMLADAGRFFEIASPSALLVAFGLIGIHAERWFADGKDQHSRHPSGVAFFFSGHALLALGLLLLFGGQLTGGWLFDPWFRGWYEAFNAQRPYVVTNTLGQCLALLLVLAGCWAYAYSDLVIGRQGLYLYGALLTLLWAEAIALELAGLEWGMELAIVALSTTALVVNLTLATLSKKTPSAIRLGPALALTLSAVPVFLGVLLHLRSVYPWLHETWRLSNGNEYFVTWTYVFAMGLAAVSCRVGAIVHSRATDASPTTYSFGAAASLLVALAGGLSLLGITTWAAQAPLLMLAPIVYLVATLLVRGKDLETPLFIAAHVATLVMVVAVVAAAIQPQHLFLAEAVTGKPLNLLLAAFFAEATLFYLIAMAIRPWSSDAFLATAMASGLVWQCLSYFSTPAPYFTVCFAWLGLGLLIAYRLDWFEKRRLARPAFNAGNTLISLATLAGSLQAASWLISGQIARSQDWNVAGMLTLLALASLVASLLVIHSDWRQAYRLAAIVHALLLFLVLNILTDLSGWQKLELFSLAVGCILLIIGHVAWAREQDSESQNELVGFALTYGSLFVAVPLTIAVLYYRMQSSTEKFSTAHSLNELGMLVAATVLLATGIVFRLRSTTFVGGLTLVVFLASLLMFVNLPDKLRSVGAAIAIVGAILFGLAILLSLYRDRLLTLPDKVRRREGIFQLLTWR